MRPTTTVVFLKRLIPVYQRGSRSTRTCKANLAIHAQENEVLKDGMYPDFPLTGD